MKGEFSMKKLKRMLAFLCMIVITVMAVLPVSAAETRAVTRQMKCYRFYVEGMIVSASQFQGLCEIPTANGAVIKAAYYGDLLPIVQQEPYSRSETTNATQLLFKRKTSYGSTPFTGLGRFYVVDYSHYATAATQTVNSIYNFGIANATDYEFIPHLLLFGDVNGDKVINDADANLIMNSSVGLVTLTEEQMEKADVNFDGFVDSKDSLRVLKYTQKELLTFF